MKKKEYISPSTEVIAIAVQQILAFSGGASMLDTSEDIIIEPTVDDSDPSDPNRARFDEWDDEEEGF